MPPGALVAGASLPCDMAGHHDVYWLYDGNTGYWSVAKTEVMASEKTSYV